MLKKTLFVLLSALILSGICFAQEESAKKQLEETTPAVTQEQPAKEQMEEKPPAEAQEQPAAAAQKQPALVLEEIQICTAVEDRQPSGVGTVFPDSLDKIYCFTKIGGAEDITNVYHVWYFGDVEIARVQLPVKAKSWRTWSSKNLHMGLGYGYVEIVSESGDILGRAEFKIQAAQKAEEVEKTEKTGVSEEAKEVEKTEKTGVSEEAKEVPKQQ
ncbi:MAG: DUF2914 domain-containing protein [Desulfobacteraceae bacterium]|nr:DUF2914 domain-containing protein [Desulfobacteraceae bacterium]